MKTITLHCLQTIKACYILGSDMQPSRASLVGVPATSVIIGQHRASDSETASILTNRSMLEVRLYEPRYYFHLWFVATLCSQWQVLKCNMHTLWCWNGFEMLPLLISAHSVFFFVFVIDAGSRWQRLRDWLIKLIELRNGKVRYC